jgi:hypothetical protein
MRAIELHCGVLAWNGAPAKMVRDQLLQGSGKAPGMLYFFDCEFIQRGTGTVDLVSIGMVTLTGRELYLESSEFGPEAADEFVRTTVLARLGPKEKRLSRQSIKDSVVKFIGTEHPTWVAYYCAYDFVCLTELFGSFSQWPKGYPKVCWDLKCEALKLGEDKLPNQENKGEHHSLADARWLRQAYLYLEQKYGLRIPEESSTPDV